MEYDKIYQVPKNTSINNLKVYTFITEGNKIDEILSLSDVNRSIPPIYNNRDAKVTQVCEEIVPYLNIFLFIIDKYATKYIGAEKID